MTNKKIPGEQPQQHQATAPFEPQDQQNARRRLQHGGHRGRKPHQAWRQQLVGQHRLRKFVGVQQLQTAGVNKEDPQDDLQ